MRYNSGTYNNQYMVIDTNLFTVGEPLKDNTLTVVEQMPNNVAVGDQFGVLNDFTTVVKLEICLNTLGKDGLFENGWLLAIVQCSIL